jgi:hypothetical protein
MSNDISAEGLKSWTQMAVKRIKGYIEDYALNVEKR